MIRLEHITKSYRMRGTNVPILKDINLTINPGERVGVLGRNGAGKSTLIRLISGVEQPTSGAIDKQMSISWPLAFGGTFLGMLTGYDNFRFICRLYDVDPATKVDFVEDFCELGRYFYEPLKTYSAGMRARLAFAVSMAVEFDCFLIDEIVAVGDSRFQQKCDDELFVKRADRAFLIVSHNADFIRDHCTSATVLENGVLRRFPNIDAAYQAYSTQQGTGPDLHVVAGANDPMMPEDAPSLVEANSEVDRREAIMDNQIASLANFMVKAIDKQLDDDTLVSFVRAFSNGFLDASTFLNVVDHLRLHGHLDAAIKFADIAVQMQGPSGLYYVVLGDLHSTMGADRLSINAYRQATAIDPLSYWGHRNLALVLFKIGDYASALPHFEQALKLGSDLGQKREIIRHIIDCGAYLEQDEASGVALSVPPPGNEISEVSCKYYENYDLLSVRVQGFVTSANPISQAQTIAVTLANTAYLPANFTFGDNSYRRYAERVGENSYSAEFLINVAEKPSAMTIELFADRKAIAEVQNPAIVSDYRDCLVDEQALDGFQGGAAQAYANHDYEMAVVFSFLALERGEAIDGEALVESLIVLGRFHDAEAYLSNVFSNPSDEAVLDESGARLFDLYCAEIARSRLSGWQQRIGQLVGNRLALAPSEASALANQGHLFVQAGQLAPAIASYKAAAQASHGRDVIHFARGISSARYADVVDVPELPDHTDRQTPTKLLHLVSCDATYFKRYGSAVVRSSCSNAGAENVATHVHIVDPDIEALDLAEKLRQRFDFRVTSEFFPFPDAPRSVHVAYYTSARFINAQALMAAYQAPVLITETDCLINWRWDEIREWCDGIDFGSMQSSLWNFVPWTKIPAGIAYFDNGPVGQAIANDIRSFLMRIFANPEAHKSNLWTIDQVALWLAWEKFGKRAKTRHLPMTSILRLATGDKTNILGQDDD